MTLTYVVVPVIVVIVFAVTTDCSRDVIRHDVIVIDAEVSQIESLVPSFIQLYIYKMKHYRYSWVITIEVVVLIQYRVAVVAIVVVVQW